MRREGSQHRRDRHAPKEPEEPGSEPEKQGRDWELESEGTGPWWAEPIMGAW